MLNRGSWCGDLLRLIRRSGSGESVSGLDRELCPLFDGIEEI